MTAAAAAELVLVVADNTAAVDTAAAALEQAEVNSTVAKGNIPVETVPEGWGRERQRLIDPGPDHWCFRWIRHGGSGPRL